MLPESVKKRDKKQIKRSDMYPLTAPEKKVSVGRKISIYFSFGLLWVVAVFSLIILPVIMQLGSHHSYFKEKVNAEVWAYFYIVLALYTLIASFYFGIKGFSINYYIIIVLNVLFLVCFFLATFFSIFLLLY
ncbi:hypothetical protein KKC06_00845 [Patescibacteria group bacterium]|nr:hypothetical protein [Patescibacteria group bacterium]